ncbi:MAG: acyl-CoA dehydrogenase family protein [Candidatus Dormibacteria bacterium]
MGAVIAELSTEQRAIVQTVRDFVEREIVPIASEYDHRDEFPEHVVDQMRDLGLFGAVVPEEYGGMGLDMVTYSMIVEEISRGWMSVSGILNTHFIAVFLIKTFGTDGQKQRFLPRLATGELRSSLGMTEAHAGSDVQAIRTRAVRDGDHYVINGEKMWVTNGRRAGMIVLLTKTDPDAVPAHRGMSAFLAEQGPGYTPSANIPKLGYKGVETTAIAFEDYRCPAENLLGGEEGRGFTQVMSGIEVGRINVASRGVGVAQAAFEEAIRYAQTRETFGKPIAQHQAIQEKLADMATKIEAARLLTRQAAARKDSGARSDLESGMAKLFASEICHEVALDALRIHGGYGYSKEYKVERFYRDAPMLLIGEGTSDILRTVVARQLLDRYKVD